MALKSMEELADQAATIVRDDDDLHIDIDTEIMEDDYIRIRRTVWRKAHQRRHQGIVEQTTLMELTQDEAVELIRDLATSLRFAVGRI